MSLWCELFCLLVLLLMLGMKCSCYQRAHKVTLKKKSSKKFQKKPKWQNPILWLIFKLFLWKSHFIHSFSNFLGVGVLTVSHRCRWHPCSRIPFKRPIPKVERIGHVSRMWYWSHCKLNWCCFIPKCVGSEFMCKVWIIMQYNIKIPKYPQTYKTCFTWK